MQKLRTNPLPGKLTQFRTVTATFPAALTARAQMLAQLHGYPQPAHVVASVQRYLKLDDINSLKRGILKLRDCVYYASEALSAVRLFRAERYQLQLAEVFEYVLEHAKDYGYTDLSQEDLNLVAYLMTSAEVQETSWLLELSPEADANTFTRLLKLYGAVCQPTVIPLPIYNKESENPVSYDATFVGAEPIYYVPLKDSLETLSSIVSPPGILRQVGLELASYTTEGDISEKLKSLQSHLSHEASLFALSDIRLLDHVLMLLTNTNIWDTFITPRTKPDPSQNVERANGLRLFAAYLQSLLVYPHMLRYELFKQGYEGLEKWHGSFPAIPTDVLANYEKYIHSYDFLDAASDARALYELYHVSMDPNLNSEIYVQFLEMTTLYGIEDAFAGTTALDTEVSTIRLEKLSELDNPMYDALLLSFPMKKFPLLDDIQSRMLERARFSSVSNQMFSAVMPGTNRFFSDAFISRLHSLGCRIPFAWHAQLPASASYDRGASSMITRGKYPMRFLAPWATAENQYALRNDEIYKIFNANKLVGKYPWKLSIDETVGEGFRKLLNRQWKSLYPASIMQGERLVDTSSIQNSEMEVERLLEMMTGEPFNMIRKALFNEPLSEIWATFMSSFCMLYKKTKKMDVGVLISGQGNPYGVTYTQLADMQKFDSAKDFIPIPRTDNYIAFLKFIPTPASDMVVGDFHLQIPYYYFPGNGARIDVKRLTMADGLLHFGLRPVMPLPSDRMILFDKLSIYRNDTLLIQVSNQASYRTDLSPEEYFNAPLTNQKWPGDKVAAQVEFISLGTYGSYPAAPQASPDANSAAVEIQKLASEMETDMAQANAESSLNKIVDHANQEAVNESSIARELNSGGTEATPVHSSKDSKKDKSRKKEDGDSSLAITVK